MIGGQIIAILDENMVDGGFDIISVNYEVIGIDPSTGKIMKQKIPLYEQEKKSDVIDAEIVE